MREHKIRVSSKGQVVIPEELRTRYGISAGTELTLRPLDENRLIVEKIPRLSEYFGILGETKTTVLLKREREAEARAESERDEELRRTPRTRQQQG